MVVEFLISQANAPAEYMLVWIPLPCHYPKAGPSTALAALRSGRDDRAVG